MLMRKLSWDTQIKALLLIVFSQIVSEIKLQKSSFIKLRAATCDFQQCGILASVNSDEPVQPPFKLRNSKWCSVSSLTLLEYSSD